MSFDLAVWYTEKRIANEEAGKLYLRLCDGDMSSHTIGPWTDFRFLGTAFNR